MVLQNLQFLMLLCIVSSVPSFSESEVGQAFSCSTLFEAPPKENVSLLCICSHLIEILCRFPL